MAGVPCALGDVDPEPPTEAAAASTSACRHPSRDLLGSRQLKHAWALLEDAKDVMGAIAAFTEGLAAAAAWA